MMIAFLLMFSSVLLEHDHLLELSRDLLAAELSILITTYTVIVAELGEFAVGLVAQREQLQAALQRMHDSVQFLQRNYWCMCRLLRLVEMDAQQSPGVVHTPLSWFVASEGTGRGSSVPLCKCICVHVLSVACQLVFVVLAAFHATGLACPGWAVHSALCICRCCLGS